MKKTILLCGVVALTALNFNACDSDEEDEVTSIVTNKLTSEFVEASDCLGSPFDESDESNDSIQPLFSLKNSQIIATFFSYTFDKNKGEILFTANNFTMGCDAIPKMDVDIKGDTLVVKPYDANTSEDRADCVCRFDITAKVKGATPKVFYVRPATMNDAEDLKTIDLGKESEGALYFYSY